MSVHVIRYILCDGVRCSTRAAMEQGEWVDDARTRLRRNGWSNRAGKFNFDLCPECVARKNEVAW